MRTLIAAGRGVALVGVALLTAVIAVGTLIPLVPGIGLGLVMLIPWPIETSRRFTNSVRGLVARWCSVEIREPYRPAPEPPQARPDGLYEQDGSLHKRPWWPAISARLDWVFRDRATGKDLLWLILHPIIGTVLAGLPLALAVAGVMETTRGRWYALLALPVAVAIAPAANKVYGLWCRLLLAPVATHRLARIRARQRWWGEHLLALVRLPVLAATGLLQFAASLLMSVAIVLTFGIGLVVVFQPVTDVVRAVANLRRRFAGSWSGHPIDEPYRPAEPPEREPDGRYRRDRHLFRTLRWASWYERQARFVHEPATWRDYVAGLAEPVGILLASVAPAACVAGVELLIAPGVADLFSGRFAGLGWIVAGLALIAVAVTIAPAQVRLYGRWASMLLAPTASDRLVARVERLTEARSDVIADQAAEVRRIERDLHDGAQARLIAVGLTLDAAERALDDDPAIARKLVVQAREASATALGELRNLVRGVHPPVLAERGLGDAVRALALDCPLPVSVSVDLPSRPDAAIESAAYFAVAEALANAVRHADASLVTVDIAVVDDGLRMTMTDNGRGGADPAAGTGLTGLTRRIGAFDGSVAVSSPAGGPTVVTMEIPCVLSSPKTSSC
ncbi:MAG TPA: sensor histidine kinase [Micromonosporaceae bacterium]